MTVVEMVVLLVVAGVRLTGLMLLEDDEDAAEKSFGSDFVVVKNIGQGWLTAVGSLILAAAHLEHHLHVVTGAASSDAAV
jgi:hypothetical protein